MSDRVPTGFRLTAFDVGDTGPSDLEKAVRDDDSPNARQALVGAGFVAGFQHLWLNSDDHEIIEFLYQFGDDRGAEAYLTYTEGLFADDPAAGTFKTFDSGVPGANAYFLAGDENAGAVIVFVKGPYLVQLVATGPTGADIPARIVPMAKDQYTRL